MISQKIFGKMSEILQNVKKMSENKEKCLKMLINAIFNFYLLLMVSPNYFSFCSDDTGDFQVTSSVSLFNLNIWERYQGTSDEVNYIRSCCILTARLKCLIFQSNAPILY